jgi:HAD superfamily hydrolase (TIGR01509 family)
MALNRITTVIFDMGGVLLRTVDPAPREAIATRFGVTRRELEAFVFSSETSILSEEGKLSDVAHWQTVMRHFGQPAGDHIQLYDEYFAGDAIDQRLLAFAASLKPKYKLGLLSNAWENARPLLRARFDFIDTFDDSIFSYEVRARKPDAAMYQAILDVMDAQPEEAVFIDDVKENVEGAQAVGMQALQFCGTETLISTLSDLLAHVP